MRFYENLCTSHNSILKVLDFSVKKGHLHFGTRSLAEFHAHELAVEVLRSLGNIPFYLDKKKKNEGKNQKRSIQKVKLD